MNEFLGFDHIDCRVRSLAAVESFYDQILPEIGLTDKRHAFVDADGEWHSAGDRYNVAEYYQPKTVPKPRHFIGIIEDPEHNRNQTRIAFRVPRAKLDSLQTLLERAGARNVQASKDEKYQAIFFEDPGGTRLEFIGR